MSNQTHTSLQQFLAENPSEAVKLHLGCGGESWPGFVNIDFHPYDPGIADCSRSGCVADVFADMRNLGLPDNSVDEVFTAHTVEHFPKWEALDMFQDWYRMFRPGGKIILETPHFWGCVMGLFLPAARYRAAARGQFYGNHIDKLDYETHRYVWSMKEMRDALENIGFSRVKISCLTQTHCSFRDMRVCAVK